MKQKLKVYIETTIPNFLYANDVPDEREITKRFFDVLKLGKFTAFTSEVVVTEISRTKDKGLQMKLFRALDGIAKFSVTPACEELARNYICQGIIPSKYEPDALHLAVATLNEMDVVVTWNMEHLANPRTRINIREFNEGCRLKAIDIATPEEVIKSV